MRLKIDNIVLLFFFICSADNDPHFVVSVRGLSDSICFDVAGRPGSVYQLIHDRVSGQSQHRNHFSSQSDSHSHCSIFFLVSWGNFHFIGKIRAEVDHRVTCRRHKFASVYMLDVVVDATTSEPIFAARRSVSFRSGICHRVLEGLADGNAFGASYITQKTLKDRHNVSMVI